MSRGAGSGRNVTRAVAWTVAAFLVYAIASSALSLLVLVSGLFHLPVFDLSPSGLLAVGWAWIVVWNLGLPLLLLFGTVWARGLNRSLAWVMIAVAALDLLSSPMPLFGKQPLFYATSFFAYDFKSTGGLMLAAALAAGALLNLVGVALFVIWQRRQVRRRDAVGSVA